MKATTKKRQRLYYVTSYTGEEKRGGRKENNNKQTKSTHKHTHVTQLCIDEHFYEEKKKTTRGEKSTFCGKVRARMIKEETNEHKTMKYGRHSSHAECCKQAERLCQETSVYKTPREEI